MFYQQSYLLKRETYLMYIFKMFSKSVYFAPKWLAFTSLVEHLFICIQKGIFTKVFPKIQIESMPHLVFEFVEYFYSFPKQIQINTTVP